MSTAVVILNWNGAKMLRKYLPSVIEHSTDAEVWVADNASTDDSMDVIATEFPSVKTLRLDKNYGFAEGYNRAVSRIQADYLVLLNSDVEVSAGWLEPMRDYLDAHSDVAAVQPKILKYLPPREDNSRPIQIFEYAGAAGGFVDKFGYPYCRGRIFSHVEDDYGQYNSPMEIHWATGACMMIRSECFRASWGFDHRFFAHNEEIDLCWRLRIMGWKIFCIPQSRVYHLGGGTLPQGNPRKTYLNFRNNLTMLYKNLPQKDLTRVMRVRTILDFIAALQSALTGHFADTKAIFKARRDFHRWKADFTEDREYIQSKRKLKPEEDLSKISILWQYHARKIHIFEKLPVLIFLLSLLPALLPAQTGKTRGIGVYPGRQGEICLPVKEENPNFRNLSLNRMAFASSSFDHNLTAQLATDGIISDEPVPTLDILVNGQTLSKREREWTIDGSIYSANKLDGETVTLEYLWSNMSVEIDSVVLYGMVVYDEEKATGGYDFFVNDDTEQLYHESNTQLPGVLRQYRLHSDANKQTAKEQLPVRRFQFAFSRQSYDNLSYLLFHLSMPGAVSWNISEVRFFFAGQPVDTALLSSSRFVSAWMSAGDGSVENEWLSVDLGDDCVVDMVKIFWGSDSRGTLQASADNKSWKTVKAIDGQAGTTETVKCNGTSCRYLRLNLDTDYNIVRELQAWGKGGYKVVAPEEPRIQGKKLLLNGGNWRLIRASQLKDDLQKVSMFGYDASGSQWITATVPATVLTSYINIGAVPNPNFDDNLFHISESFFNSNFIYRRVFQMPAHRANQKVLLNLDGINWKANVWVNGRKCGEVDGAFIRGNIDVTGIVKEGNNVVAIEIVKPDHPGAVKTKNSQSTDINGGLLGADNPTFHASVGWDWISTVRGREIGIWNDVYLTIENDVSLSDPMVVSELNLPDTLASVSPGIVVCNNTNRELSGRLCGWIGDWKFEKDVTLKTGRAYINFSPEEFQQLKEQKMRLWWPNGYGEPYLYDAGFVFLNADGKEIDRVEYKTGIRQMTWEGKDTALKLFINGRRFVPYGGNWGFSEANLNYRKREYDTAVRYHRDMNFNMIRNWVGQTGDSEFYDACDKYGIMVWQDFWLANPSDGPDPIDNEMFEKNANDYILKIRQHPSICLYCGRNEGVPPEYLDRTLSFYVQSRHPGMLYISDSADKGVSGHGPYWAIPAQEYFSRQTGLLHSERGMPNIMTYEGLQRTFRPEHLWPQNDVWGQHDFTQAGAQRGASFNAMVSGYGTAYNAEEYSRLAQFVNYDGYRAMFESCSRTRMGLIIWMSHACWPSLTWQCYDYYFEPTAAFFGCKKACEPLHIQYNALTRKVEVVNICKGDKKKLTAEYTVMDITGKVLSQKSMKVASMNDSCLELDSIAQPQSASVYFLKLQLKDKKSVISDNFYILTTHEGDYRALADLPKAEVRSSVQYQQQKAVVTLENTSKVPALMIRLNLKDTDGEQILPVDYSDNYINLMPGEKKTVEVSWLEEDQKTEEVRIEIKQ